MESLFKTIDVRDLFSSSESTSTPISAPDLRLLISRLDTHSLQIKSTVQSYLLSHQAEFSCLFSQCSDVVSKSESVSSQVIALLNLISDHPIESDVKGIIGDILEKKRELKGKREILDVVGVISELDRKLGVVRENVKNGRVLEAAIGLKELKALHGVSDKEVVDGEPIVYGVLRNHLADSFEEIQDLFLRFMENALRFDQEENSVHIKYRATVNEVDEFELYTILKSLDAADILEYGLAKFADLIIKHVVTPVVSFGAVPSFTEEIDQDLKHVPDAILKVVPCVDPERSKLNGEAVYTNLVQIIEFLHKFLCFQNGPWMRCFGKLTWPRISDLIISNFLSKAVPDDPSKLVEFQEIMKLTAGFETSLKALEFISPFDTKDEKLSRFVDNIEVHFASRKKIQILAKARNLLLQANFSVAQDRIKRISGLNKKNNIVDDFTDHVVLLFSSEKCVVTEAANELMELVHQTLKDVCLLPPKVGLEFYHAARNALVLYEAIVPVKLERQLDSINQAAILIHNDCLYLSQEILGLAFEYRPYFPSSVMESAVFVDLAPRFQLVAEEVLQRQIQLVMYNLKQAIDGADGFQNTHQIKQFDSAKFCIDQVSFIIEKVHIIWEPLMLPSIYQKSMTMILKAIFFRVAKEILLLDDLAAEETLQLQKLIQLLFEHLSSLLESLLAIGQENQSQDDNFKDFVLSMRKLQKLAELLDMPLKSITTAWESGELAHCNFTLTEVEDFIRAIFTDSPLRKECLFRIENSSAKL